LKTVSDKPLFAQPGAQRARENRASIICQDVWNSRALRATGVPESFCSGFLEFWVAWMRLPIAHAWRDTLRICRASRPRVLSAALRGLPRVVRRRRVLPENVLLLYRMLRG
jgi:hypothetical protein